MARWKLFPTRTSRNISLILAIGMGIIYCGSMFLYAIFVSPKNQMPSDIEVENDFVKVVRASQDLTGLLSKDNIELFLRGKKIVSCIYSETKQGRHGIPDNWRCNDGLKIKNFTRITDFNIQALRELQRRNKSSHDGHVDYNYKVLIKSGTNYKYEVAQNVVRAAELATRIDFSNASVEDENLLRGRGIRIDFVNSLPSGQHAVTSVNPEQLRKKVYANIDRFTIYVKLKTGSRYLQITPYKVDKRWLVITSTPPPMKQPLILMGFIFSACSFLIAIIILCFWAVRNASVPVNKFLMASKRFGRDLQAPPMAIEGSKEMRAVIREFNNMQAKIRRLVLDRTQMLAAISHDLRTPITRLLMRIEYLQGTEQYDKAVKDLKEMDQMIRSILAFARDYASNEVMERFDIGALLESICDDLQDTKMDVSYTTWDFQQVFLGLLKP